MGTQQTGEQGEQTALSHLRSKGMRLLQRNFSCRMGEIDLVMVDRSLTCSPPYSLNHTRILVFVEVRFRRANQYGGAAASVTPTKQQRLIRTAKRFLQLHPRYRNWPCRFDVVALSGDPAVPRVDWIKSAFTL